MNRSFPSSSQISYMTWVAEGILNKDQPWQSWRPRWPSKTVFIGSEITFAFLLQLGMTILNECVNLPRSNRLLNSQEIIFWRQLCQASVSMLGFQVFGASRVRDFHFWEAASYFRGTIAVLLRYVAGRSRTFIILDIFHFLQLYFNILLQSYILHFQYQCIKFWHDKFTHFTVKYGFISILNCWFEIWI